MLHKKDPLKCLTCKSKCLFRILHLSHSMRSLLLAMPMRVTPCNLGNVSGAGPRVSAGVLLGLCESASPLCSLLMSPVP